jgi:hypothetical protein
MSKVRIALTLALFIAPAAAGPIHSCTVIAQDLSSDQLEIRPAPLNTNIYRVPLGSFSNIVVVETEGERLILSESGKKNPLVFTVGEEAQFIFQHSWLIFQDTNGKKHKFAVVHTEIIAGVPPER